MREILFRGKSNHSGEWFYGNLYHKDTSGRTHIATIHKGCLDIDPQTVGQFTGLTDKHGNKIFEGDILKMPFPETYIVKFINGAFVLVRPNEEDRYSNICYWEDAEITGNIHDNPELLNLNLNTKDNDKI